MPLKQPIGQKRLTNVAIVKYKKKGNWFETACYKNKVVDWRNGTETDLDEVLQTTAVFKNVSKGVLAKEKDLVDAFGTNDERAICTEILTRGDLQVSEKERKLEYENLFKGVATVLSEKCVDPNTNRPYTITMIERALKDVHFNVDPKKSAKVQAFGEALPLLQERFSIQRANMRLRLKLAAACKDEIQSRLAEHKVIVESKEADGATVAIVCQADPGLYQVLLALVRDLGKGHGHLEVVSLAVQREGMSGEGQASGDIQGILKEQQRASELSQVPYVTSQPASTTGRLRARSEEDSMAEVSYPRGPISGIPDDVTRKPMFLEIDGLQPGWEVELTKRGESGVVDAVFFSPSGEKVGAFVQARRAALSASKKAAAAQSTVE
ncbi:unnamed protein product [Ostreobium quekettii]|uniref:Ribosome maturation protein SBDS n=1 Tax=Ostreobium quekettii TaxID=121088 RepID=A0A8S1JIP9_9CHLO|nr:unnamed protein product [Ostreobium quekettii]|eukprot:evm.model.scf_219.2 EVM.evm.TU.scf_219.2   scf_219:16134-21737(+)